MQLSFWLESRVGLAMADPLKLFVGRLHLWVERTELLAAIRWLSDVEPVDVFIPEPTGSIMVKCAFVTFRRSSP